MSFLKYFITLTAALSLFTTVYSEPFPVIAVDHANPPFMYADNNTEVALGLYPEIIHAVFNDIGAEVKIKAMPWARALNLCKEGIVGIGGIYKTNARERIFEYSDPIFEEKLVIYVLKESPFSFRSIPDLSNKKIGVIRGWSYGDEFDAARDKSIFTAVASKSDDINFKHLLNGNIDCLIAIQEAGSQVIKNNAYQQQVIMLPSPLSVNPTYIVFKRTSNHSPLIQRINKSIQSLKTSGRYDAILNNAIGMNTPKINDSSAESEVP